MSKGIKNILKQAGFMVVGAAVLATSAAARDKRDLIGSFRDWDALVSVDAQKRKTCYMISMPKSWSASKKNVRRGDIYLMVTHRPSYGVTGEVNAVMGYPLRQDSQVALSVDGKADLKLFTEGSGAWAYDAQDDARLIAAMKRGNNMVIKGVSGRGTETTDKYSLSGFTAAYNAITRACR
ncbi:hypothetical protein GCM10017044_05510 [Kordiimonas sediminis]|uniref:Invasion associated locus B family protein n=1 Tax=Kordiimonas sediminis TaxID=1735581 RepID=A0A919ALK6_9PROT|nr:invasion associated locus B family protein [Kordiimonas sediminis]GHF14315.1 hypothetical protein GCM10017044_05510 [Kordiimonas sediminis]